jgi:hypothetical protein
METIPPPNIILRGPYQRSLDHVYDELARIELLVRAQVIRWRHSAACAGAEHNWGMVVVSNEEVDHYLNSPVVPVDSLPTAVSGFLKPWWDKAEELRAEIDKHCQTNLRVQLRLNTLSRLFRLSPGERDILVLLLLAEIDERYRRLFAYLQNDASRETLSYELVTQILRPSLPHAGNLRDLFSGSGHLLLRRLIHLELSANATSTLPLRALRIDERIASYLLGGDAIDNRLSGILETHTQGQVEPIYLGDETRALLERLPESLYFYLQERRENVRLFFQGPDQRVAARIARNLASALRLPILEFDLAAAVRSDRGFELLVDLAYREAQLAGTALFFHHAEALLNNDEHTARWEYLQDAARSFPGLTMASADSSEITSHAVNDAQFWIVNLPLPDYATRKACWLTHLPFHLESAENQDQYEHLASELASAFQTTEAQIEDALTGAANLARRESPFGAQISPRFIFEACRRQAGKRLVAFAQRIEPRASLSVDDVILPEPNKRQFLDLQNRIRFHREVFSRSGLDHSMRLGKGILALFAGTSGTGKTMAAEALASSQGVDLYRVDLSAIVSKWIGETEKNLSRIFSEAERSNGWLFFDEGESLFGSRAEIKQAQDRMLNLEVNYLLQRIEEFSGVVLLATNLRGHIDDAFLRRIHAVVDFPQPNAQFRAMIWKKLLPEPSARDFDDLQLRKLAARFEISGGNIRNIVVDAMFRSYASRSKLLNLRHVIDGLARECQKLGRPILAAEFGEEFYSWVVEDILDPPPVLLSVVV